MSAGPPLTASYRLQMNARFTLGDALERIGYWDALGVSHLYLSPIMAARHGSMHGYDVIDPSRINPEIGDEAGLRALSSELHARGMGLIVDIVPNHMGIGPENRYWDDVLAHGEHSRYARWFDIDWAQRDGLHRKLILPVLGDELEQVIERGELGIELREGETPRVTYYDNTFPLDPASLPPELQLAQVDPEEAGELAAAYARPENGEQLRALLDHQHYRLAEWRSGTAEINYRRFFDVNDLAALRMEEPAVFDETHGYILHLVAEGLVDGLRVDHIDGLLDPRAYLDRLRSATSPDTLIFVEKILSPGETLRGDWPVQGTTGYEFMNTLGDVFIDAEGFALLDTAYQRLRKMGNASFEETARAGKRKALEGPLHADVARLAALFALAARAAGHRWPAVDVTHTLVELIAALPVYRTYIAPGAPIHPDDRAVIERAVDEARATANEEIVNFVRELLLAESGAAGDESRLRFVQRLQQLSGPATAKGVEDTALYAYLPLASRNEVGGSPDRPLGNAVDRLHDENLRRAREWPLGLIATNTHDTKRSADVRSRLEAISEIPEDWERSVLRWRGMNETHRTIVNGRSSPDLNTEYLLYQTLVALWPASGAGDAGHAGNALPDRAWREDTRARIAEYMLKASREAKTRTNWLSPDESYEEGLRDFIDALLDEGSASGFLADVGRLASRVIPVGTRNALSRVVLHLTSPGTPDIYQGDELWNFALVDPDNRRSVDYERRASLIAECHSIEQELQRGGLELTDDRLKLFVTHRLLRLRRTRPELFLRGTYRRLEVRGAHAANLVAVLRSFENRHVLAIAPRLVGELSRAVAAYGWSNTAIELPSDAATVSWQSEFLPSTMAAERGFLPVTSILSKLPVAVLAG